MAAIAYEAYRLRAALRRWRVPTASCKPGLERAMACALAAAVAADAGRWSTRSRLQQLWPYTCQLCLCLASPSRLASGLRH